MISPQEQKDIDLLNEAIQKEKLNTFSFLSSLNEADINQLKYSGYGGKTNAEAMQMAFQGSLKKIKKLIVEHVQRYPD